MFYTVAVYVNHRPAFGLSPVHLIHAFRALAAADDEEGVELGAGPGGSSSVDRRTLLSMLQEHGEIELETTSF